MAAYEIPGIGMIDLGNFDPSNLGGLGYGGTYDAALYAAAARSGQSLTDYLNTLDDLQRGRYSKPTADMNATELAELSGIPGLQFVTNIGKGASTKANNSGFVPLVEDAEYRIVNERGKNQTVFSGIGQEGLIGVYNTAQNLSAEGGKKADWYVEARDPSTGRWIKVADDDPPSNIVGDALDILGDAALGFVVAGPIGAAVGAGLSAAGVNVTDIAVPIITTALLTPVLGPAAGVIVGSGVGSTGASLAQGRSLEESLIRGLTAAVTAGAVEGIPGVRDAISGFANEIGLDKAIADGLTDNITRSINQVVSGTSGAVAASGGDIVVNAVRGLVDAPLTAGVGALTPQLINSISDFAEQAIVDAATQYDLESAFDQQFGTGPTPAPGEPPITVTAKINDAVQKMIASGISSATSALFPDLTPAELSQVQDAYDQQNPPGTVVTGAPGADAAVGGIGGGLGVVQPDGTIEVTAREETPIPPEDTTDAVVGGIGGGLGVVQPDGTIEVTAREERPGGDATAGAAGATAATQTPEANDTTDAEGKDDGEGLGAKDWIRLALLGAGAIGGGAGGGGSGTPVDNTPLTYTPITRRPTIAAGVGQAPFDVFTYGQGIPGAQQSEFMFFEPFSWKQPEGAAPINVSTGRPQAQLDAEAAAAAAAQQAAYDANVAEFNAYQDDLAAKVAAGTITPEQATADATAYAGTLDLPLAPVTTPATSGAGMKDGGEVDDEMMRHLMEYKRGGGHNGPGPVKGVGGGQEDLIPAWLSDGEYVWSAQDVADLGDGSTDEGVRRLDKMRQMVRRRAGRKDVKKIAKPQQGIDTMLKAVGGVA